MATIVEQAPTIPSRPTTPPPHLTLNTSVRGTPAPIPNKHIPVCSPGRAPGTGLTTPPTSPPTRNSSLASVSYVLHPADPFSTVSLTPKVYAIESAKVHEALERYATQPLPDPKLVFPWLHGLHAENAIQLAFFVARKRTLRRVPQALRGITIVKAGGDLSRSKLKGAVAPEELLSAQSFISDAEDSRFIESDPKDGFSVRNFQIQACKMATVSDVIVYGDDETTADEVLLLGERMAWAQMHAREKLFAMGWESGEFNTFVVLSMLVPLRSISVTN
jgi:dual specificity MAP kinase phosphatase